MSEQPPIHEPRKGKYNSARDEALHIMAVQGWANDSAGDVESTTGFFSKISIDDAELPEITEAFEQELIEAGVTDTRTLIGHFMVLEDNYGNVNVDTYTEQWKLDQDFESYKNEWIIWAEDNER
jgi:hypothetical protein